MVIEYKSMRDSRVRLQSALRKDTGSLIAPPAGQALRLNVVPLLKGQKVPSSSYTWMTTDGAHTRRPRSPSPSLGVQEITRVTFNQMLLHPYTQLPTSDPNYAT
ncbi:uncharacterized protein isoform X5 [Macaca fascicularis]|uniref:uncharacterized protein isoform X5 n=1 Tax=Macaca fascicularis TaxID=9541 RepID=UPI003D15E81C